jgi:hypothetical protein
MSGPTANQRPLKTEAVSTGDKEKRKRIKEREKD